MHCKEGKHIVEKQVCGLCDEMVMEIWLVKCENVTNHFINA
jgi:hypothetical protein